MSSVMGFASKQTTDNHSRDESNERLDLLQDHRHQPTTALSLPAETFLEAAVSLKHQVVQVTWCEGGGHNHENSMGMDPTAYTGLLGTAILCFRSYQATGCAGDLQLCQDIVDACASQVRSSTRHVSFLCGKGGVYALGAVVANLRGTIGNVTCS